MGELRTDEATPSLVPSRSERANGDGDQPSSYNIIIGRPTLNRLKAITSTYHLLMKFATVKGIAMMLGDQSMARMCYIQAWTGKKMERW